MEIEMFKAQKQTKRFRKNQKVFVALHQANFLYIVFRYRGKGRYVKGIIDLWAKNGQGISPTIGRLIPIDVKEEFAEMITQKHFK